jgi:FMN phosphatase YigB (HAD superfamily)
VNDLVILLDVDNTLLDSDLALERLRRQIAGVLDAERSARFWEFYEQVRSDTERVSLPETVERFAAEFPDPDRAAEISAIIAEFPYHECVYPESLRVIEHVSSFGLPVIVSDGDQLFQRYKIRAAGLEAAVGGNVLIFAHKERHIDEIERRFPSRHYAAVDDKEHVLAAMKSVLGPRITTLMVRQGKYALAPRQHDVREPDITLETIGCLIETTADELARRT